MRRHTIYRFALHTGAHVYTDMTRGNPLKLIIKFSLPMLIGGVFQQFYNIIDMLIVGKVNGSRDLAAIGATSSATFFILSITLGVTVAYSVVVSQHFGANNLRRVRRAFVSSIYITGTCVVILALAGILAARPILLAMQTPTEIIDSAVLYIQICMGGGIGLLVYNAAASVLRGIGDSRTPLYFLILSSVLNVLLDLAFVLLFHMGVKGVAIATVISQTVSAAICVWYMLRRYPFFRIGREDLKPDLASIRTIVVIGLSMGLQALFLSVGDMFAAAVANTFGTDVVAAYATGNRIQQMATLLYFLLSESFAVYVGQNLGAREIERIKHGFRSVLAIVLAMAALSAVIVFVFGGTMVRWFIAAEDPHIDAVVEIAVEMLTIGCLFYPFLGMIFLYNNTLRGMGEVKTPLLSGIAELTCKIGLAWFLASRYGYHGFWFAVPAGWLVGTIPVLICYHRGRWIELAGKIAPPESVRMVSERFLK